MPAQRLKQFLDSKNVRYVSINHSMAFTALEIAKSAHLSSKEMAKTIILLIDDQPVMAVLPAAYKIDLEMLRDAFETINVELASEQDFAKLFPDCEVGAMPPFGNLYAMDIYIAESITEHTYIAFSAGSHSEVIRMTYNDYEALVSPSFIMLAS